MPAWNYCTINSQNIQPRSALQYALPQHIYIHTNQKFNVYNVCVKPDARSSILSPLLLNVILQLHSLSNSNILVYTKRPLRWRVGGDWQTFFPPLADRPHPLKTSAGQDWQSMYPSTPCRSYNRNQTDGRATAHFPSPAVSLETLKNYTNKRACCASATPKMHLWAESRFSSQTKTLLHSPRVVYSHPRT